MSKTLGNVIRPRELIARFGVDASRYLVLSAFPFGTDGDISLASFVERFNADLANDLGNLLSRTVSMVNRYFEGVVQAAAGQGLAVDEDLKTTARLSFAALDQAISNLALSEGLAAIWQLIGRANKYVEENAPWVLAKTDRQRLATVLYNLVESLRLIAHAVSPFMPTTAGVIAAQLGLELNAREDWQKTIQWGGYPVGCTVTNKPAPLFPRIQ
jgi:methionyl-tRNA synthetase